MKLPAFASALAVAVLLLTAAAPGPDSFRFVVIGDRTGETQPGVYERVLQEVEDERPAFAVSVGDTIQGMHDATADAEWQQVRAEWPIFFAIHLTPGNHDIWSRKSEELFRKYSGYAPHYSFDYEQAHFTVLDNSRSEDLSEAELSFLEDDLEGHKDQPLKFIVSHRPSWLVKAIIGDADFPLQRIARKYGAHYVIAGHLHEMLHARLEGIDYISMASAGGHFRASGRYEDGWFFGYAEVDVQGREAEFHIHELGAPYGEGRITALGDWGPAGLIR